VNQLEALGRIFADALARKAAGTALGESVTRLASAVDIAELGFVESANEARVTFMDARTRDLLGIPTDTGHAAREFWIAHLHPGDRERVLEISRAMLSGRQSRGSLQYRYLHPERGMLWIDHLSRVTARDADGIPTGERVPPTAGPWDDAFTDLTADPVLEWPGQLRLSVASTCSWWVVYSMPEHAICVEPQSGPPDALNIAPEVVEPSAPLMHVMRWRWERIQRATG